MWPYDRVLARFGRPITHMHLCTCMDIHTRTHAYTPSLVPRKKINRTKQKIAINVFLKKTLLLCRVVVTHTFDHSTWEAKTGGFPQI